MQAYSDNPLMDKAPLLPLSEQHKINDLAQLRKKRRARRFGHALVSTACLALVMYLVTRNSSGHFTWGKCGEHGVHEMGRNIDGLEYTIPKNVDLVHCVDREEWIASNVKNSTELHFQYTSEASFDLPVSSDTLFLISRGQNLGGNVNVVTSDEQDKDSATVVVSLSYNRDRARDLTKVCLLSREENENGIGVFTPIWRGGRHSDRFIHRVNYRITVVLPASEKSPLHVNYLETDLPNTSQHFEYLSNVSFDKLSLRATNGFIGFESLLSRTGSIATTNGRIEGTLSSSSLWTLSSTNGPIKVNVNLTSTDDSNATFIAHTTNSPIKANFHLISSSGTGGTFYVSTTTTNSPLRVEFPTSPVKSTLNLKATTTNGPAVVALDTAYEGKFDLHTSSAFRPNLHFKTDPEDPAGRGRRRTIHAMEGRRESSGVIVWGDEPQAQGSVTVSTTNSPVALIA